MNLAKQGDTVKINYVTKLSDGTVFDASFQKQTFEFTIGQGEVIPGLEHMVVGMQPGESKTVIIKAEEAFGPYIKEKVVDMRRELLPEGLKIETGGHIQGRNIEGVPYFITIKEVSESTVTIDANHPLAGQDLIFELTLVEIA